MTKHSSIEKLVRLYCESNGIEINNGFPEDEKHDLMKFIADHRKIGVRKFYKRKKFNDTKINNILEGVLKCMT